MTEVNLGMPTTFRPPGLAVIRDGQRVYEGEEPLRISNSELQTWKECHRKWYLGYYRGLRMNGDTAEAHGPRSLGTRVHACLEHYYTSEEPVLEFLKKIYDDTATWLLANGRPYDIEGIWKEYDLAHAMMTGYIEWVEENAIDEGIDVVAAEDVVEVSTPIPGVNIRGKMDQRVVRKSDGVRLFRDFKTVGNLTSPTKMLHMDEQMKFYHLLEFLDSLEKTGGEPQWRTDGALYTMLRKTKRTEKANPPFFGQVEVRHNRDTIRSMWIRVMRELEEIFDAHVALDAGSDHHYIAYPRPNGDCSWKCDFFPVCPMFDDGSNADGMLGAYYYVGDPDERYNKEDKGDE